MAEREKMTVDSGVACFLRVLHYLGRSMSAEDLRRSYIFPTGRMEYLSMVRIARELGLEAGLLEYPREDGGLAIPPVPAIAKMKNGEYIMVSQQAADKIRGFSLNDRKRWLWTQAEFRRFWSGKLVLFSRKDLRDSEDADTSIVSWHNLWQLVSCQWRSLRIVVLLSCLLQLIMLISPLFMQYLIDKVLVQHGVKALNLLAVGMVLLCAFQGWISFLRRLLLNHVAEKIDMVLNARILQRVLHLPLSFWLQFSAGDLVNRLRELRTVRQFLLGTAVSAGLNIIFSVVYLVVLFHYNEELTWLTVAIGFGMVLLNFALVPWLRRKLREKYILESQKEEFLLALLQGIATVKTMVLECAAFKRWQEKIAQQVKASYDIDRVHAVGINLTRTMNQLLMVLILWLGVPKIMAGDFTVGALVAFQLYANNVMQPFVQLAMLWQDWQQAKISIEYMRDIAEAPVEEGNGQLMDHPVKGNLSLRSVSYAYPDASRSSLDGISMEVPAGSMIGIVGPSGAGKTTLLRLLQSMIKPDDGSILLDGMDIWKYDLGWLRRHVGFIIQNGMLFQGTIRDNIRLVEPHASEDVVVKAAKEAGAHDFIMKLPRQYDTLVGENGASLSGGQRQKIAMARMLFANPEILIFDEATSGLDPQSDRYWREQLPKIKRGRTCIIISHRLADVEACDCIYYMEDGHIAEAGKHGELMAKKGGYYQLAVFE